MSDGERLPPPRADLAWFFDVDGTVAEIADTPDAVFVDPGIEKLVADLHRRSRGALALVSGRPLAKIDELFNGARYPAAGQHGLERRTASGTVTRPLERGPALAAAQAALADVVGLHPGLRLEVKPASLALHYRQAPQLGGFVHRTMKRVVAELGDGFHLQPGKRVVELLPKGSDKGTAVEAFLAEPPFTGRTPVFVGDDLTDEHAFAIVNERGGYSVKVGPGRTVARWRLRDVRAVRAWLEGEDH